VVRAAEVGISEVGISEVGSEEARLDEIYTAEAGLPS
jgi:hypothetical protein